MKDIRIEKDFRRPWGGFIKFINNEPCTVKMLFIKKKESLSLQSHKLRQEFWHVASGKVKVSLGKSPKKLKKKFLKKNDCILIPPKTIHRAEALEESALLEISTGKFKESDEIRYEDKYGRAN